jgi:uncharacterized Zn-binding protein involved in type VI secretion
MRLLWSFLALTALTATALAQVDWTEQGDAGDLPETAQSTGNGALAQIQGNLSADDVDMYAIYITDPANFSASTVGGATFDTQLWLFDSDGKGVVFNDDAVGTTVPQSRIDNSSGCLTDRPPGIYYLAISRYDRDATGCERGLIWLSTPFRAVRCPDGAERASRVAGWSGSTGAGGAYTIFLTGAEGATAGDPADCPPQLPREFTLTDGDATFTLRGIRGERTTSAGGLGDYKSLGGTAPDHMFQNWWWYRTGTDTREFALSNLTAFEQPQANTVSLTYAEGGLTYEITYTLSDSGDNQAVVVAQLTIANTTSTPITLNLFNYSDFDMDGSVGGDRAELVRPDYMRVYETNTAHIVAAETPFAWQIGAYPGVRDLLTDTDIDDLNNSGSPFGPGDFTGAFQWEFTLQDGESRSTAIALTINVEPPSCQQHNGDVDDNGCVDDADLLAVLFAFGQTGDNLGRVDVNCDQVVDDADLLQVLFNFGSGC